MLTKIGSPCVVARSEPQWHRASLSIVSPVFNRLQPDMVAYPQEEARP